MASKPQPVFQAKDGLGLEQQLTDGVASIQEAPIIGYDWQGMETAPQNRAIYVTADPDTDPDGVLVHWRTTREKLPGRKRWRMKSFWALMLTKRAVTFEPFCWRESMNGGAAALVAATEQDAA